MISSDKPTATITREKIRRSRFATGPGFAWTDWRKLKREQFKRAVNVKHPVVYPVASAHWLATPSPPYQDSGQAWTIVKNLGWLLRHWRDVDCFAVYDGPHDTTRSRAADGGVLRTYKWDALLVAYTRDGRFLYSTPFASRSVLRQFLDRSVFQGLPVNWFGTVEEIGSKKYRRR